jgi:hypothetical protein
MSNIQSKVNPILPFKSVAGALLFSVLLGPIGLLYASLLGGVIMICIGIVFMSKPTALLMAMVWTVSCIWSVAATNRYNHKILKIWQDYH